MSSGLSDVCSRTPAHAPPTQIDTFESRKEAIEVAPKVEPFHGVLNDKDVQRVVDLVKEGAVKTVVLDCGGVLLKTDVRKLLKEMTVKEKAWMTAFTIWKRKTPDMQWLSDKLAKLVQDDRFNGSLQIYNEGIRLPPIMCLWQAGIVDAPAAHKMVSQAIKKAVANGQLSKLDAGVLRAMCRMAFDNDAFIKTRCIVPSGLKLLRELQNYRDVQVALLTNFDAEVFERLRDDFREVFDLIDPANVLVSSDVKLVKPDAQFFALLQERIGFDAASALMVDDEPRNALGARQVYGYAMVTGGTLYKA